jgi:hypothetical protein
MFLRIATTLLPLKPDPTVLSEAREKADQILAQLPSEELRHHFKEAGPVRTLGQLMQ